MIKSSNTYDIENILTKYPRSKEKLGKEMRGGQENREWRGWGRGVKKTSAPLHLLGRSAKNKQLRYACPIELFQYADSLTFNQNHWSDGIIDPVLHL